MKKINEIIKDTKNSDSKFLVIIFIFLLAIHIPWINLQGVSAGDTSGYIDVSKRWFSSDLIYFRPVMYPVFIFLAKVIGSGVFGAIVYIQTIFYAMSGVLFYKLLIQQNVRFNKLLLLGLVLISFSVPQALQMNEVILPEMIPLFFILLLFYFILKPASLKNSFIIPIILIIVILMKPLWLLLLAFPVIKYIYSDKGLKNLIYGMVIPLTITVLLYSFNQYLVAKETPNQVTASTLDVNTNLSLIRMGLIDGSKNTKLNSYLDSKKLTKEISQRTWTNKDNEFSNFTKIKNQIPWEFREDSGFWKSILFKNTDNLISYSSFQLSRLPVFFSTSGENARVKFLPDLLNSIYQRFYSNVHSKHIVGVSFLIFSCIISLFNFKNLTIHKILSFLIIGVSVVLCLLTYQNPHFLRMRAVIEPLIIYTALYTLLRISTFIYERFFLKERLSPNI